jgi:hypothetical protein
MQSSYADRFRQTDRQTNTPADRHTQTHRPTHGQHHRRRTKRERQRHQPIRLYTRTYDQKKNALPVLSSHRFGGGGRSGSTLHLALAIPWEAHLTAQVQGFRGVEPNKGFLFLEGSRASFWYHFGAILDQFWSHFGATCSSRASFHCTGARDSRGRV